MDIKCKEHKKDRNWKAEYKKFKEEENFSFDITLKGYGETQEEAKENLLKVATHFRSLFKDYKK